MTNLRGKVALVTGARRGIAQATAIALANAGADIALNDIEDDQQLQETLDTCRASGVRARLAIADVADLAAVEKCVAETVAEFGRLDIGVSGAVYSDREPFTEADMQGFRRTVDVTMWGAFHLLRAASQQMIRQDEGGAIVLISSPHAYMAWPNAMAYNMSKAATDQMAKTAANELCQHRIRVNVVYPGWIDTPGERKFYSEEELREKGGELSWGRLGTAEEIGRGVVFLCDPESDYITGTSLLIDGGHCLPRK